MMWNYQGMEQNSTGMKGVNLEIPIAAQEIHPEKTPLPPHSDAPLPHADSYAFILHPQYINPWSFYPCFGRCVVVSRFKKIGRPGQYTKPKSFPTTVRYTINYSNSCLAMPSPTSSPSHAQHDELNSDQCDSSDDSASSKTEGNSGYHVTGLFVAS